MLKQPAWAAAMSSSGLVPMPFSKRVLNEYWVLERTPLGVETVPFPSFNPPAQWALPVRCISSSLEIRNCWTQVTRTPKILRGWQTDSLPRRKCFTRRFTSAKAFPSCRCSVKVRATQVESTPWTHQFAMVALQQRRAVGADLCDVYRVHGSVWARIARGAGIRIVAGIALNQVMRFPYSAMK